MLNINLTGLIPSENEGQTQSLSPNGSNIPSVLTLAQAELSAFQHDALRETQEDLGFALGGRIKDTRRSKEDEVSARNRVLLHKLVTEVAMVEPNELEDQLTSGAWKQSPQLLTALLPEPPEPGVAALQLAIWLAHGKPAGKLRTSMEKALATLMRKEETSLSIFGALEFGNITPGLRQELVRLYQRASAPRQKLSQWLGQLGERQQRQRKIRTLLRLLSYELSASGQPIVGNHLASVISDLRQLLRILALENYCDQAVLALAIPTINGEYLMALVVQLIDQIWLNSDSLSDMLPVINSFDKYRLLQSLLKLVQLLPDECFNDKEQKKQLGEAITTLRECFIE